MQTSFIYSLPYILFVLLYIILTIVELDSAGNPRLKQNIRFICIIAFVYFLGLRGFIGWDWYNYYPFFLKIPTVWESFSSIETYYTQTSFEIGFCIYTSIVKSIVNDYHFYIFVSVVIDVLIINAFIKRYSRWYAFTFLIYLVMGSLALEIDVLRNIKAIMFFMLSIPYIEKRRFIPFLILNLIGFTFHTSALLFFLSYFFLTRPIPLKLFVAIIIVGNIIFILRIPISKTIVLFVGDIIGGKVQYLAQMYYKVVAEGSYGMSVGFIERTITSILIIIYYKRILLKESYNVLFLNAYMIYIVLFLYFGEVRTVSIRLTSLFFFPYAILIPQIYDLIRIRSNKKIFLSYLFVYSLLKSYGLTNLPIFKYDNITFPHYEQYEERKIIHQIVDQDALNQKIDNINE